MKSFLLIMVMAAALPVKALANPACAVCTVAIGASLSVAGLKIRLSVYGPARC